MRALLARYRAWRARRDARELTCVECRRPVTREDAYWDAGLPVCSLTCLSATESSRAW